MALRQAEKILPASHEGSVYKAKWKNSSTVQKSDFFHFLQNKALSDVKLCAEGKFIYAHRVILAASSRYFKVSARRESFAA